jgi:uncharacterized membrane protein
MNSEQPADNDDKTQKDKLNSSPANTEWIPILINSVTPLAKEYVDLQKSKFDYKVKRDERASQHNRKLIFSLLLFLGAIIGISSLLTFYGKVSGDALLFMIGVIVGYIITMIQGLIYEPWQYDENEGD